MNEKEKLKALMEGLEIQNIDSFIERAGVGDYRKLGEMHINKVRTITLDTSTDKQLRDTIETLSRRSKLL